MKALIIKGAEIYNSETNINLAELYYLLGDSLLRQIEEDDDELFGKQGGNYD